jgi:NhaA family Na+:H+ antiporter
VAERLEYALHPWTSYVIVPLFALANAGVSLDLRTLADARWSRVTLGVAFGLVVGKTVGISSFTWLAQRLGVASLPEGVGMRQVLGVAAVAAIGFTVALFVATLAFGDGTLEEQAKVGIFLGSVLGSIVGIVILRTASPRRDSS